MIDTSRLVAGWESLNIENIKLPIPQPTLSLKSPRKHPFSPDQ